MNIIDALGSEKAASLNLSPESAQEVSQRFSNAVNLLNNILSSAQHAELGKSGGPLWPRAERKENDFFVAPPPPRDFIGVHTNQFEAYFRNAARNILRTNPAAKEEMKIQIQENFMGSVAAELKAFVQAKSLDDPCLAGSALVVNEGGAVRLNQSHLRLLIETMHAYMLSYEHTKKELTDLNLQVAIDENKKKNPFSQSLVDLVSIERVARELPLGQVPGMETLKIPGVNWAEITKLVDKLAEFEAASTFKDQTVSNVVYQPVFADMSQKFILELEKALANQDFPLERRLSLAFARADSVTMLQKIGAGEDSPLPFKMLRTREWLDQLNSFALNFKDQIPTLPLEQQQHAIAFVNMVNRSYPKLIECLNQCMGIIKPTEVQMQPKETQIGTFRINIDGQEIPLKVNATVSQLTYDGKSAGQIEHPVTEKTKAAIMAGEVFIGKDVYIGPRMDIIDGANITGNGKIMPQYMPGIKDYTFLCDDEVFKFEAYVAQVVQRQYQEYLDLGPINRELHLQTMSFPTNTEEARRYIDGKMEIQELMNSSFIEPLSVTRFREIQINKERKLNPLNPDPEKVYGIVNGYVHGKGFDYQLESGSQINGFALGAVKHTGSLFIEQGSVLVAPDALMLYRPNNNTMALQSNYTALIQDAREMTAFFTKCKSVAQGQEQSQLNNQFSTILNRATLTAANAYPALSRQMQEIDMASFTFDSPLKKELLSAFTAHISSMDDKILTIKGGETIGRYENAHINMLECLDKLMARHSQLAALAQFEAGASREERIFRSLPKILDALNDTLNAWPVSSKDMFPDVLAVKEIFKDRDTASICFNHCALTAMSLVLEPNNPCHIQSRHGQDTLMSQDMFDARFKTSNMALSELSTISPDGKNYQFTSLQHLAGYISESVKCEKMLPIEPVPQPQPSGFDRASSGISYIEVKEHIIAEQAWRAAQRESIQQETTQWIPGSN